ncbi:MAG: transcriptional regulator [candidate division GAL15 bacterium]
MTSRTFHSTRFHGVAPRAKEEILARLRSIEGHVRGVLRMVEEDAYCIDILKQTRAVQAALDRVNALLLERHLHHCVSTAIRSDDPQERERVIAELLDVFEARGERR